MIVPLPRVLEDQQRVGFDLFLDVDRELHGARRAGLGELDLLRPDAKRDRTVRTFDRAGNRTGAKDPALDHAVDRVHRRPTHELRNEAVGRPAVDGPWLVELHQLAFLQNRDARRQRHRLFLVVSDEDEGLVELAVQAVEFGAHVQAQQRIEVGKRLVHQADRRFPDKRTRHRDALRLAAGELRRLAMQIVADPQKVGDVS